MALITDQTRRIIPPHEPESWFDVRTMRAGDMSGFEVESGFINLSFDLLASVITAWSYEAPVSAETVKTLDIDTYAWLAGELKELSGIRSASEKKDSTSGLSRQPRTRGAGRTS